MAKAPTMGRKKAKKKKNRKREREKEREPFCTKSCEKVSNEKGEEWLMKKKRWKLSHEKDVL